MYGDLEKIHEWLLGGGRRGHGDAKILQPSGRTTRAQKRTGAIVAVETPTNKKRR